MRQFFGLGTAVIGMLMCMIFTFSLTYMYAETKIDEKLVGLELTTLKDDFCV